MLFRLSAIPNVQLFVNAPLARHTRFQIGGPARMLANVSTAEALSETMRLEAGATLQDLVDKTIDAGLHGLETMTGIPGWVGGAIYGNAGAYGHSIQERVESVRFFDGKVFRDLDNPGCEFQYRESVFKRHKDWIVTSASLRLDPASAAELRTTA